MELQLRCVRCGEVIGVYEPMLIVEDGQVRETSRLLEQARTPVRTPAEDCFHEACFEDAYEEAHRPHLRRPRRVRDSPDHRPRQRAGRDVGDGRGAPGGVRV